MYKYETIIYWSEEDQTFIAEVPELPGRMAYHRMKLYPTRKRLFSFGLIRLGNLVIQYQNPRDVASSMRKAPNTALNPPGIWGNV